MNHSFLPPTTPTVPSTPQSTRICIRCHHAGPDLILPSCQCALHARCTPVPIRVCPNPHHSHIPLHPGCPLELLPMDFSELDEAKKSPSTKRGSKPAKKKAKIDDLDTVAIFTDLRTGRWTNEETTHCDNLIHQFMMGRLPLSDGLKLNDFLSGMLKSKQSRLTKKMKNAKLSSKTFKRSLGFLADDVEARAFSDAELAFFHSIPNLLERAVMKFHMAKEWREAFSTYCVSHGQGLNADSWLSSVEEMDRRNQREKEKEREKRREMMMGCALKQDLLNPDRGVLIDSCKSVGQADTGGVVGLNERHHDSMERAHNFMDINGNSHSAMTFTTDHGLSMSSSLQAQLVSSTNTTSNESSTPNAASPFLHKIVAFVHRNYVPFEYFDVWVPSFVPEAEHTDEPSSDQPKCRLCFAGSLIAKQVILETTNTRHAVPLSPDDQFNLSSFGEYSESFSFDVGCGLPGRVYHMGVPTWEQSVHNAPLNHFERVGGAQQWGIRTVVGIPVPSPNVGRVVVILYSRYDRAKDHDLVIRMTEEFTRLMPSPKWKLVVDVGETQVKPLVEQKTFNVTQGSVLSVNDNAALTSEVISMFGEHMPSEPSDAGFGYLKCFMSLRLLLLRPTRTEQEQDIVDTILSSYSSYKAGGRTRSDMALMLVRDFMLLNQLQQQTMESVGQQGLGMESFLPIGSINGNSNHTNEIHPVAMNAAPALSSTEDSHQAAAPQSFENNGMSHPPSALSTQNESEYISQKVMGSSQDQEYFMIGDMEPAPMNPQNPNSTTSQSPLDAVGEHVENVSSDNTESVTAHQI